MRLWRVAFPVFWTLCLSATGGCIRNYCEARGVTGRLLDAASGETICGVSVAVTIDGHRTEAVSEGDGSFDVKPRYRPVFWIMGDWASVPPVVEVAAAGFEPHKTGGAEEQLRQEADYVRLGDLHLRKR